MNHQQNSSNRKTTRKEKGLAIDQIDQTTVISHLLIDDPTVPECDYEDHVEQRFLHERLLEDVDLLDESVANVHARGNLSEHGKSMLNTVSMGLNTASFR